MNGFSVDSHTYIELLYVENCRYGRVGPAVVAAGYR